MSLVKSLIFVSFAIASTSCTQASLSSSQPDNVPTKTATKGESPRLFDCVGENQTTKGNTRKDCLPNDADGAARDTEAGSGGTLLKP